MDFEEDLPQWLAVTVVVNVGLRGIGRRTSE